MGFGVYDLNLISDGENISESLPERCLRGFLPDCCGDAWMRPDVVFASFCSSSLNSAARPAKATDGLCYVLTSSGC